MILYTIVPTEYIFEPDPEIDSSLTENKLVEIRRGRANLLAELLPEGQAKIIRIVSTDPQDYLNPNWQPGIIMPTF